MISLQDLLSRVDQKPGSETIAARHLSAAIGSFERLTGKLWNRRTGVQREVDLGMNAHRRNDPIFIEEPNTTITALEEWDAGFDPSVSAEFDEVTGVGAWRQLRKGEDIVEVLGVSHSWSRFVRLTYSCGYDTADESIPEHRMDIVEAVVSQAEFTLRRFTGDPMLFRSRSVEGSSVDYLPGAYHPLFYEAVKHHQGKLL